MKKIILITILIFFYSCASTKVIQVKEDERIKEVNELFNKLNIRKNKIKTIFSEAKVDIFEKEKRVRGKLMISLEKYDKFRIDTLSPFDAPISIMLIKDDLLTFHDVRKKKTYQGVANNYNISRFIPINLNKKQFIDMISGVAPIIKYKQKEIEYEEKDANYKIVLTNNKQKQIIKYDANSLDIKELTIYNNNKKRFYIKFSNMKKSNNIKYAKKIFFQDYLKNSKIKLKITDIEFNQNLNDEIFQEKNKFKLIKL